MTRKEELLLKANQICNEPKYDCKSTEDLCYIAMEWADRTMLDKVCKYLISKLKNGKVLSIQLIDNLRKAMEE